MFYQLVKNLRSTWYLSGAGESLRIELLEASRPIFRISQPGSLYVCTFACHFVKEKRNNERERQRGSDRAFQHFGLSFYQKCWIDLDRTRTCNPQIRSLVPYPLGHKVFWWLELRTWKYRPVNVATQYHPNLIYLRLKLLILPAIITNILRIWISQKRLLLSSWKWSQHFFDSHASQIRSFRLFNGSEVLCE